MWKNKLLIDNVSLRIIRGVDKITGHIYKELVIGYKTIYINTYVVGVFDLSNHNDHN